MLVFGELLTNSIGVMRSPLTAPEKLLKSMFITKGLLLTCMRKNNKYGFFGVESQFMSPKVVNHFFKTLHSHE
jgi:hypothetical protein